LNSDLETITLSKVSTRLIPFLSVLYIAAFIDRVSVGFVGPLIIGWIKASTGSFTWGLVALAAGVLSTGVIALLIGDCTPQPVHTAVLNSEAST
jgi:hypothetical protein